MGNNAKSENKPDVVKGRARQARAVELRADGKKFREIAEILGYASGGTARAAMMNALSKRSIKAVDKLRRIESAKLVMLEEAIWPKAMAGDLPAIGEVRLLIAARRRLFGLDMPVKADIRLDANIKVDATAKDNRDSLRMLHGDPEAMAALRLVAKRHFELESDVGANGANGRANGSGNGHDVDGEWEEGE